MTDAELAHTKELAFWMVERVFMNPISAKLLNEDWRKAFPDEVAVAERMKALVEALELKEEQRANWFQMAQKLGDDLDAAEKRIAELESRTVTIEPFRSFVTDADLAALHRFAECCDDPESGGHDLEKEQVRRLEAIGALQRSGRISYITGFGDFLISITAGIKWEAE
ncbi:MAG: hypothetical protein E7L23_20865 [Klebsiella grimontii]|nr:hypothetical protein [Klebsiella grimontii]